MSSPAASAPFAALVLAWDETTPAARVPLEASALLVPDPDPIAVLVPTGPLAEALSQEKFLPLDASAQLPEPPALPTPSAELLAETEIEAAPAPVATTAAVESASPLLAAAGLPELASAPAAEAPAKPLPAEVAPATAAALVGPALVWQEVRVLQLPDQAPTQPGLVWEGWPGVPAAPYLGSSEPVSAAQGVIAPDDSAVAAALLAASDSAAAALLALHRWPLPTTGLLAAAEESSARPQPAYLTDELPVATDAESDAVPTPATDELLPVTDASTTELSEQAADPAEPFAVDTSPVQTESVEPTPPPIETLKVADLAAEVSSSPTPEPAASPDLAALHLPAQAFDAANLNFQIIQYARLAVPQALAAQPFGVIYAPAWPTWLAAQELRQRTGQPLVLHLAQLAATEDELIDLAAGWAAEIQRQALHRADLILTETPALAQRLRRELALPAHRVRPVPAADATAVALALCGVERG